MRRTILLAILIGFLIGFLTPVVTLDMWKTIPLIAFLIFLPIVFYWERNQKPEDIPGLRGLIWFLTLLLIISLYAIWFHPVPIMAGYGFAAFAAASIIPVYFGGIDRLRVGWRSREMVRAAALAIGAAAFSLFYPFLGTEMQRELAMPSANLMLLFLALVWVDWLARRRPPRPEGIWRRWPSLDTLSDVFRLLMVTFGFLVIVGRILSAPLNQRALLDVLLFATAALWAVFELGAWLRKGGEGRS